MTKQKTNPIFYGNFLRRYFNVFSFHWELIPSRRYGNTSDKKDSKRKPVEVKVWKSAL